MCCISFRAAILCLGVIAIAELTSARWCSKLIKVDYIKTEYVPEKCNQTYQASCGWFSSDQCTYSEIVDCVKKYNKTLTRYKTIEECCRGFILDPATNVTCIRRPVQSTDSKPKSQKQVPVEKDEVNTVPVHSALSTNRLDAGSSSGALPSKNISKQSLGTGSYSEVRLFEEDDTLFLGLSHGAYAGIVCFSAFIICVIILIILNARKKFIRSKHKDRPLRMSEISESLMPASTQA